MRHRTMFGVLLVLAVAIALVYANSLNNGFHLDDTYGLVDNPAIRQLSNIPSYFVDPQTLTSLKSNADYRPLLQATYALNYAISGYGPWSWHILNLLFHLCVCINLYLIGKSLFGSDRIAAIPWLRTDDGDRVAFAAALIFAVHPIGSGVANYMWARSSLLVAVWVSLALVFYLRMLRAEDSRTRRARLLMSLGMYALALLTKIEAIGFLGIVALIEWLLRPPGKAGAERALRWQCLGAFAALSFAYLGLYQWILPDWVAAARHESDITAYSYFVTQLRVWWHYVERFLAPVWLVADDKSYPVSTSILDPAVLHAGFAWLCVLLLTFFLRKKAPAVVFLVLAFFVCLSPHSSFSPLAEMTNEHRPYLAAICLSLLFALGLMRLSNGLGARPAVFLALLAGFTVTLGSLTYARNQVWSNELTLWEDVVNKAPLSSRGQLNYGLALMDRGRFKEAEYRFKEAARLAPVYSLPRINLAIAVERLGRQAEALPLYDEAIGLSPDDARGYYWKGLYLARQGENAEAYANFKAAIAKDPRSAAAIAAGAEALLKLNREDEARALVADGMKLDPVRFRRLQERIESGELGAGR